MQEHAAHFDRFTATADQDDRALFLFTFTRTRVDVHGHVPSAEMDRWVDVAEVGDNYFARLTGSNGLPDVGIDDLDDRFGQELHSHAWTTDGSQDAKFGRGISIGQLQSVRIDECLTKGGWQRIGALALGEPRVYAEPLAERGLEVEAIGSPLRDLLDQAILRFMAGHTGVQETAVALQAVEELRGRGVDGIILGCTEIPLLLGAAAEAVDLINPAQLLAETAVRNSQR